MCSNFCFYFHFHCNSLPSPTRPGRFKPNQDLEVGVREIVHRCKGMHRKERWGGARQRRSSLPPFLPPSKTNALHLDHLSGSGLGAKAAHTSTYQSRGREGRNYYCCKPYSSQAKELEEVVEQGQWNVWPGEEMWPGGGGWLHLIPSLRIPTPTLALCTTDLSFHCNSSPTEIKQPTGFALLLPLESNTFCSVENFCQVCEGPQFWYESGLCCIQHTEVSTTEAKRGAHFMAQMIKPHILSIQLELVHTCKYIFLIFHHSALGWAY